MISTRETAVTQETTRSNSRRAGATEVAKPVYRNRRAATIVGVLFLMTEVTAIVGLKLYDPILTGPNYLVNGFAHQPQVIMGAILELLLVCANIGTAIGLFPFLRKYNESLALGYLCFRVMEAVIITIGIVAVLSLVTLSQAFSAAAPANAAAFEAAGAVAKAVHDWTFLMGPNFVLGVNTVMCGYLLYRSRLVPRVIGVMGMVGSTVVVLAGVLEMFGVIPQLSTGALLLGLPIFAYEVTLAVWLIVKGFNVSAIPSAAARTEPHDLFSAA